MSVGDSMNFFTPAPLVKGHRSQDGRQDHPRAMNPGKGFVQADGPARNRTGHSGREDRKVRSCQIQPRGYGAKRSMQIAASGAGRLAPSLAATDHGSEQRYGRN